TSTSREARAREAVRRRWRRGSRPRPRTRPVARRARRRGPASAAEPARSTLAGPPKKLRERLDPRDAVPEEGGHRERDQRDGGRDVGILGDDAHQEIEVDRDPERECRRRGGDETRRERDEPFGRP